MYRVVGALVAGRDHSSDTAREDVVQLLASSCRLLSFSGPDLIDSTSVTVAVSSVEQAERFADVAEELAAAHSLIASVQLAEGRFRVRFTRLRETAGSVGGGQ